MQTVTDIACLVVIYRNLQFYSDLDSILDLMNFFGIQRWNCVPCLFPPGQRRLVIPKNCETLPIFRPLRML